MAAESESSEHNQEVQELKQRLSKLKRDYDTAVIENKTKQAMEEHYVSITQHKQ